MTSKFNQKDKIYLGDGIYAKFEGYDVVLTTEDGIEITNTIVLEPEVLDNLNQWLMRRFKEDYKKVE